MMGKLLLPRKKGSTKKVDPDWRSPSLSLEFNQKPPNLLHSAVLSWERKVENTASSMASRM